MKIESITDFENLDDVYDFILKFKNWINFNATTFAFKGVKPYEMASVAANNSIIDEAIEGLKNLGYKMEKINEILPSLNEMKFETSADCLKEALKLLTSKN